MELVDKNKIEEILRNLWKKDDGHNSEHCVYYNKALQEVQCELDTLEVKEVDLEKEIKDYFDSQPIITRSKGVDYQLIPTSVDIAKRFFELGLNVAKISEP